MVGFMQATNLILSVNPATGERIAEYPPHSPAEASERLTRCRDAFRAWSRRPLDERLPVLARAGALLRKRRDELAKLATLEMGKTLAAAEAEVEKCAWVCEHYAQHASGMLASQQVASEASDSYVRFDPLGVLLAIMPWNFPYWQAFRAAAPALAAGNAVALKHASNVSGCALAMERLWRDAGLPEHTFTVLLVPGGEATALAAHTAVAAVTLTGSEPAGASVGAIAGRALKKIVLELGGSDPFIVLADADIATAAAQAAAARVINNGQSCIAAKRFIVAAPIYDHFVRDFSAAMAALRIGDPAAPDTELGPLALASIRDGVADQVDRSIAAGARRLAGGQRLDGAGYFYPPTVLADVPLDAPAAREEVFGPVAAVFRVGGIDEAIALANASTFGLAAAAWTRDRAEADRLAHELESGSVFINGMVASDQRFPFGGVKRSGYGRELGVFGLREFVNIKTVRMADLG
jgi:succinate-semialdehyde dehydrogenase/glutarate-semialdehyde dehydrogenase